MEHIHIDRSIQGEHHIQGFGHNLHRITEIGFRFPFQLHDKYQEVFSNQMYENLYNMNCIFNLYHNY